VRTSEAGRALAAKRRANLEADARAALAAVAPQVPDLPQAPNAMRAMRRAIYMQHALNAYDPSAHGSAASARLVLHDSAPPAADGRQVPGEQEQDADLAELLAVWRKAKEKDPTLAERARQAMGDAA